MVFLRQVGLRPVVVHGGGPQINAMLDRLGIASEFQGGLRVTTPEAMDVVRMVLTGQVTPRAGRPDQRARPGRRRPVGGGRRPAGRRAPARHRAGRARRRRPRGRRRPGGPARGGGPAGSRSHPRGVHGRARQGRPDPGAERQRRHRRLGARGGPGRQQAHRADGRRGAVHAAGPTGARSCERITAPELSELLPTLEAGMVPKMEACLRAVEGGVAAARSSTAASRTVRCWRSLPRGATGRWWFRRRKV